VVTQIVRGEIDISATMERPATTTDLTPNGHSAAALVCSRLMSLGDPIRMNRSGNVGAACLNVVSDLCHELALQRLASRPVYPGKLPTLLQRQSRQDQATNRHAFATRPSCPMSAASPVQSNGRTDLWAITCGFCSRPFGRPNPHSPCVQVALKGLDRARAVNEANVRIRPQQIQRIADNPGLLALRSPCKNMEWYIMFLAPSRQVRLGAAIDMYLPAHVDERLVIINAL
jgi:hypothetical protein